MDQERLKLDPGCLVQKSLDPAMAQMVYHMNLARLSENN